MAEIEEEQEESEGGSWEEYQHIKQAWQDYLDRKKGDDDAE